MAMTPAMRAFALTPSSLRLPALWPVLAARKSLFFSEVAKLLGYIYSKCVL